MSPTPPASPRAKRVPLDRGAVLSAAVALADQEGVDAVSMRRLAQELGVVAMAIYKHVADKEDLIDGMVDVVVAEFAGSSAGEQSGQPDGAGQAAGDWQTQAREQILAARRSVQAHPWARRAMETRTLRTPTVLRHMEALTATLLGGGLTPDLTHHAMHVLGNRIWGFSPELFNEPHGAAPAPPRRTSTAAPDPADFPAIMAVAGDAAARRPGASSCDEEFEFVFGVHLILDAVEQLRAAGWSSPVEARFSAAENVP